MSLVGEEGVPIQVDGEAWVQPPGMIRIIHKNRMQMLCRNKVNTFGVRMHSLVLFTIFYVYGLFLKIRY
jgi:hypothetical protein